MDDRTQVIDRLRALELDGGSHENLSAIARAILPDATFGWTVGACGRLRDTLVALIGGETMAVVRDGITDELREWAKGFENVWVKPVSKEVTITTGGSMPVDHVNMRLFIEGIADRIDVEHERNVDEKIEAIRRDVEEGWVRLPVDADGVRWYFGDVLLDDGIPCEVVGIGPNRLYYYVDVTDTVEWTQADGRRHYHAPTVEDVLREFTHAILNQKAEYREQNIAEYAAKLRLAGEGE